MATYIPGDWWVRRRITKAGYRMRPTHLVNRIDLTDDEKVVLEKAFLCGICYRMRSVRFEGEDSITCGACKNPVCVECMEGLFQRANLARMQFAEDHKEKVLMSCPFCRKVMHVQRFIAGETVLYDTWYGVWNWNWDEEFQLRNDMALFVEEWNNHPALPAIPRAFMDR